MYTYQDLQKAPNKEEFIISAINRHKSTEKYQTAQDAEEYYQHRNPTIMKYQKYLFNSRGQKVPDTWAANNKIASNWFFYFTVQAVQYLLGNGVNFKKETTLPKLGKDFEKKLQELATEAKIGSCSYGFWNYDKIEVFKYTEFVPLYDEDNGSLRAGIRFWQLESDKPLHATLYEEDGYTEFVRAKDKPMEVLEEKRAYILQIKSTPADGIIDVVGENYSGFPIVPFYNINKQSDLVGNRGTIDAYDLINSELVNNISEGEFVYWILKNCGGMSEVDDAQFVEQLKLTHVAHADGDDGAEINNHKVDIPFQANESGREALRGQLYKDFMALDVDSLPAGNITAEQIRASYELINQKTDLFENCVVAFIRRILELIGVDDEPSFVRSVIVNQKEVIDILLTSAEYLDADFITKRICTILGCPEEAEGIIERRNADDIKRFEEGE